MFYAVLCCRRYQDTECVCFDFKQNIPFPHLPRGDVFYLRQLWLFVFGVNSAKTVKSKMYTWPETQAKRGVNENVSCLSHFICSSIPKTLRTLYVFIDGWGGQNHNHTMVNYLQTLVLNGSFDKVIHRLPQLFTMWPWLWHNWEITKKDGGCGVTFRMGGHD